MRTRLHVLLACLVVAVPLAVSAGARAASAPSTPVNLTPTQVPQALFVAGDVSRLGQIPIGTESLVDSPASAVSALAAGANESARFTALVSGGRTTTKVAALRGTR